jgi:phage shock protein PspC (stress-responsive transcriptional regulator)
MNKTIIININGIVFHIEEDAYDVLRAYMTEVKRHFAYSPDSDEIVTDIENRLAEMFNERLAADQKQVIVPGDVTYVTERMGNVSEFGGDEDDSTEQDSGSYRTAKKLFRDMDDRVIGGVCAGVAHYFGIEPRWARLLAIISVLIAGSGIPVYLILWIVIPKALTRADKMAMKGEPINIQNFKKNFDEEVEGLKSGFNRVQKEARPAIDVLGKFIGSAGIMVVRLGVAFIAFLGIMGMIVLIIGLITFLGYWSSNQLNTFPFNIVNADFKSILTLSAFIVIFIPLTALVMFAFTVLSTRFTIPKTVYFTMLILWLGGFGVGVYHVSKVTAEFNTEATFSATTALKPSGTYYLRVNPAQYLSKEDSLNYRIDSSGFKGRIIMNTRRGELNLPRNVTIKIVHGDFGKPQIIQEFSANGPNFETALATARRAKHVFIQTDSVLMFNGNTYFPRGELWRDQKVNLILRIPENTRLRIETPVNRYLEDYSLWECPANDMRTASLSDWTMTAAGLRCQTELKNYSDTTRIK